MTADAVGGVWTYAMDLTRELARRGHEVVLAVMGPPPDEAQRAEASHVTLAIGPYRLEWMRDPWRDVDRAGGWLLDLAEAHAPDVVHLNGYAHAALPWRAPVLVVAHSCVLTWWRAVHGEDAPREWDAYRARVAEGLSAASLVVAPTRALLDEMRGLYGFSTSARVIPNGRAPAARSAVEKLPVALAVGRVWDEAKDMRALDEAAGGLPWPVRVVGDDTSPEGDARPRLAHAHALGRLSPGALRRAYAEASLLAHPARYEPFGLAPLEAAHAGCALVLSDIPTLREVWGEAALYARPADAASLHEALLRAMEDAPLRQRLAHAAAERARRYTPTAMADAYEEAYGQLSPSTEEPPCAS